MSADTPVLGRLPEFPGREAVPASYRRADGREVAVIVVRRGAELRAFLDLCPHQFLPLTWRGRKVLSADGGASAAPTTAPTSPSRTAGGCQARAARAA